MQERKKSSPVTADWHSLKLVKKMFSKAYLEDEKKKKRAEHT